MMTTNATNVGGNSDAPVNKTPHQMAPKKPTPFALRVRNFAAKSLRFGSTIVGIAVAANVASHYYESNQVESFFGNTIDSNDIDKEGAQSEPDKSKGKSKKCVLVLPFQNLKLVERKSGDFDDLKRLGPDRNKQPTIVLEAKELVKIIHTAASDPNITALHADFGEGMRFPMGLGHMEEIRNTIRVFNESHRVHRDPNVNHNPVFAMPRNGDPKPSYAFGHSFQWNEYFLASSFTYVHLQARGNLHLFGVTASNTFIRSALDKYGIKAHVFKHGDYKTAPNVFTEDKYSKSHLEAVKSMTSSLNNTICSCIERSRDLKFDNVMWKSIFDYGSLTSTNAAEIGLVDSIFPVDPLLSLLHANKEVAAGDKQKSVNTKNTSKEKKTKLEEIFGLNKSFDKFVATEQVSLVKYHDMMKKKTKLEERRKFWTKMAESGTAASIILSTIGLAPREPKLLPSKVEKVAVVTVDGSIDSALSYEIIEALRKIRIDETVKCLVLRVNSPGGSVTSSEAILEELKILEKVH
jgi:ClpP class serine protease